MIYLRYLKSLLLHKWFVFLAGLHTGVPLWRLIIHDWTKFLPVEFVSYARHFQGQSTKQTKLAFDYGWLHHQKANPHHWQYWILVYDSDPEKVKSLPMPETYVREMVADWMGASRAYTGSWNMSKWLSSNGPKMLIHDATEVLVDQVLTEMGYYLTDNCMWSYMKNPSLELK
ncbi:MAG: hypothetical protein KDK05_16480 [Candidatus Competibacteraceae bacterium]|nr:hypothetical protein [Candidatus Competibacteraceae bacterium]